MTHKKDHGGTSLTAGDGVSVSVPTTQLPHVVPERPKLSAKEVREVAALKIADELLSERHDDFKGNTREELATDLFAVIGASRDGYEICRNLEDRGWEVDTELVEKLDGGYHIHCAYDAAIKAWVIRHQIQPVFAVGDRVVFDGYKGRNYSEKAPIEGEITKVEPYRAQYVIFVESEGHVREGVGTHGTYINFEDVRPIGSGNQLSEAKRAEGTSRSAAQKRS